MMTPTDRLLTGSLLVAPLVLSTIVVGIAHMGDSGALGRIGFRAITWFIIASFVSIALGLLMVNLFTPGVGAPIPDAAEAATPSERARQLGPASPTVTAGVTGHSIDARQEPLGR